VIASGKSRTFAHQETAVPPTTFNYAYAAGLMDHPSFVRHVAFAGHLHHGKSSLVDLLVHQTHPTVARHPGGDKTIRYTDTRFDEQERGLSIKMTPMSFVAADLRDKSLLLNVLDTPGHVNFSDEQTAAYRLADAAVIVVDAVEGVMLATERAVRHAVQEQLPVMLVINKVDRLILELKLPPQDAYHKLVHTIEEVNDILDKLNYFAATPAPVAAAAGTAASASAGTAASPAAAAASDESGLPRRVRLNPAANNVCFASALHGWIFSCASFAKVRSSFLVAHRLARLSASLLR
jgi:small GTP-binding protein